MAVLPVVERSRLSVIPRFTRGSSSRPTASTPARRRTRTRSRWRSTCSDHYGDRFYSSAQLHLSVRVQSGDADFVCGGGRCVDETTSIDGATERLPAAIRAIPGSTDVIFSTVVGTRLPSSIRPADAGSIRRLPIASRLPPRSRSRHGQRPAGPYHRGPVLRCAGDRDQRS